ncbi:MAG: hypothetical protein ACYSWO_01310 [Planctomycetota bacterium]|jgi:hypothetical protein
MIPRNLLATKLDELLHAAIQSGGKEPEVIRKFAKSAEAIKNPLNIRIRTGFIHQRPYVFFVEPSKIADRVKCELGDLLYVYRHVDRTGSLRNAKACFVQVKQGREHWPIEPHQLEFLANIKRIQFRFGNSVHKRGGLKPIIYNGLPHSGELAQYLLIGGPSESSISGALSYSVKRVMRRQKLYQQRLSISRLNPIACKEGKVDLCDNHDSHMRFLIRFCHGADGAKLSGQLRRIVELIYKRIDWDLAPPEEYAKYFVEDGRGFCVIEITSREHPGSELLERKIRDRRQD